MEGTVNISVEPNLPVSEAMQDALSPFSLDDPLTPESISSLNPNRIKQIWAVGGGKGGVGKSLVASSLAIALSRMGNKVIAVDLDLGGANLHTTLGLDLPKQTLGDFFSQRIPGIQN